MVLVRETTQQDWRALRDIRLAALRDAPDAFASTYDEQAAFTERDWRARIESGGTFLAYLPEVSASEPVGLAGGYRLTPQVTELVSMYVRPRARGRKVGEALIDAVIGWARDKGATAVHLWVTETNKHARMLYERHGFNLTGERQPLPSNRSVSELGMSRRL
jgi:GNAT superfamily N-acetyltransferase